MIKYKPGVDPHAIHEAMHFWIPYIYSAYQDKFPERDMVITSGYRPNHPGAHGRGEAIDLRRYPEYTSAKYVAFCRDLQHHYGEWLGVQLEPEWGQGKHYTAPHIHIQVKWVT